MFPQRAFSLANMIGCVNKTLNFANQVIWAGSLVSPEHLKFAKETCETFDSKSMTLEDVIEVMERGTEEGKKIVSAVNNPVFFV